MVIFQFCDQFSRINLPATVRWKNQRLAFNQRFDDDSVTLGLVDGDTLTVFTVDAIKFSWQAFEISLKTMICTVESGTVRRKYTHKPTSIADEVLGEPNIRDEGVARINLVGDALRAWSKDSSFMETNDFSSCMVNYFHSPTFSRVQKCFKAADFNCDPKYTKIIVLLCQVFNTSVSGDEMVQALKEVFGYVVPFKITRIYGMNGVSVKSKGETDGEDGSFEGLLTYMLQRDTPST